MKPRPPRPYTARPATEADTDAIAAVANACEAAFAPEPARFGRREVGIWLDRAVATTVVLDGERVVGFGLATPRGGPLGTECLVLPEATGHGLGSFLVDWCEGQAEERHASAVRCGVLAGDETAKRLLTGRGFAYIRSFYRMLIDLDEPPPAPRWPDGIEASSLREDEERLLYEVVEDSFAEHWGHVPRDFDEWRRGLPLEHDLTFLARDGAEVAGAVVCHEDLFGDALVGILGVRKPWRGRGLGRALLLHGFHALYDRGKRRIGLGVDAGNETGALELYRSVGMWVGGQDDVYERRR